LRKLVAHNGDVLETKPVEFGLEISDRRAAKDEHKRYNRW
jgi:hypothetical protein